MKRESTSDCQKCRDSYAQTAGYHPRCMKHEMEHRDACADLTRREFYQLQWDERNPDRAGMYPPWIAQMDPTKKLKDEHPDEEGT